VHIGVYFTLSKSGRAKREQAMSWYRAVCSRKEGVGKGSMKSPAAGSSTEREG